jgi:hypothetical protein
VAVAQLRCDKPGLAMYTVPAVLVKASAFVQQRVVPEALSIPGFPGISASDQALAFLWTSPRWPMLGRYTGDGFWVARRWSDLYSTTTTTQPSVGATYWVLASPERAGGPLFGR